MSINCEHCLEMLKKKMKSHVVCVVLYRILKYVFLLRHLACSGYIKRIILSIDNEWCHKVNCAPSSGSFIIVVNCGVGCLGGFGVPHWWLWGWRGVENTLKCTEITYNTRGSPLIKNLSSGVGVDGVINHIKESRSPLSRNRVPGPLGKSLIGLPGL